MKMNSSNKASLRLLVGAVSLLALAGCASQAGHQEMMEQQAAVQAEARELAVQFQQAERARLEAERSERELREQLAIIQREREAAEAAREEAEQRAEERARQAAVLQQQQMAAERARMAQAEEERIAAMERQLAEYEARISRREQANARLREAITAAEELLQMLATEQSKYDNVDANGQTAEPLQKALISELESRKDRLVREAQSLSN